MIVILPDRAALARAAARRFVTLACEAIESRGRFAVALAGGSTPRDLYALLATPEFATQVDWTRVHFFWGDERAVPPDHPDSNYRMAQETWLSKIPVSPQNIHRIRAELSPDVAAREYENTLRLFFNLDADEHRQAQIKNNSPRSSTFIRVPTFDLIILGLGADGHTASLFPHTPILDETERWVAAVFVEKLGTYRITLTVPIINAAQNIWWLVAGTDKADTVRAVLHGAYRPADLPAQRIQPAKGNVVWLLDQAASVKLNE